MFKTLFTTALLLCAFLSPIKAQTIDHTLSKITFKIKNMKFRTVEGSFSDMTGMVDIKDHSIQHIEACIPTTTVNTESKKRDEHLKNEDFFDVNTYPEICFESSQIEKKDGQFTANGKLSLHGITKSIQIPLKMQGNKISGSFTLNRLDYNLGESTGTFMVGDEVEITITCIIK